MRNQPTLEVVKIISAIGVIFLLGLALSHLENRGILQTFRIALNAYLASYESNYWVLCHSKVKIYTQNQPTNP